MISDAIAASGAQAPDIYIYIYVYIYIQYMFVLFSIYTNTGQMFVFFDAEGSRKMPHNEATASAKAAAVTDGLKALQ